MAKMLILDIETNSLDIKKAEIIEFGFILTDNFNIIKSGSFLIKCENTIPDDIEALLTISNNFLNSYGCEKKEAYNKIAKLIDESDFVVVHNGFKFDIPILENQINLDLFKGKTIIDTMKHLPKDFYSKCENRKLKFLCIEQGIYLSQAHRAMLDVTMLYCLLKKFSELDLSTIVENALKISCTYKIEVSFNDKELAKKIGGTWNSECSRWEIELYEDDYVELVKKIKSDIQMSSKLSLKKVSL